MKRFPVITPKGHVVPKSVTWEFVEPFREQAWRNHGQTLERLAERGGLCPIELYAAAHGFNPFSGRAPEIDVKHAIEWLYSASGEPRP